MREDKDFTCAVLLHAFSRKYEQQDLYQQRFITVTNSTHLESLLGF
jgi:hypothetical protein